MQLTIAVLFSALVALFAGVGKGWPAAMGGAIAVLGSLVYALIVTRANSDPKAIFRRHFRAEMVKLFITAVLFIAVLVLFPSAASVWLILGFAVTTLAYWFSLLAV
nr:ATP synthase subunit I [Pseudoduganella umbonata]